VFPVTACGSPVCAKLPVFSITRLSASYEYSRSPTGLPANVQLIPVTCESLS
jgi:hypothetical protein